MHDGTTVVAAEVEEHEMVKILKQTESSTYTKNKTHELNKSLILLLLVSVSLKVNVLRSHEVKLTCMEWFLMFIDTKFVLRSYPSLTVRGKDKQRGKIGKKPGRQWYLLL